MITVLGWDWPLGESFFDNQEQVVLFVFWGLFGAGAFSVLLQVDSSLRSIRPNFQLPYVAQRVQLRTNRASAPSGAFGGVYS